ncbi:HAD family phosphatase [Actinotalea sp. K2]|uniref:HAD family hydrolase n=1 Tax=Actinotalea sp. K2 TaxID=2939438 RepID=UPI002016C0EC|nr:HAD family phosphatase [Actinotalea sp. K2]MCL3860334.1 HAD family phosphatase [Actinotalea sp. K2]
MVLTGHAAASLLRRRGAGLLLDLDGTLVDSEPVHRAAFRAYFASRGWDVEEEVVRLFGGRRAQEVFPTLDGPWRGEDPHTLTAGVIDALRASTTRPAPVPGAAELVAACLRRGVPAVIVTSAGHEWVDRALDGLGVARDALPRVTAEDCAAGKPDPEPYLRGIAALDLPAGGLVAVEDTPAGVTSARVAGVGTVLGITTSHPREALRGADDVVADLAVLARALTPSDGRSGRH